MLTDVFDLDSQHSYFPVSSSRPALGNDFRSLAVNTTQVRNNVNGSHHERDSLLLRAWAISLHAYIQHNPICFAVLPSLIPTHDHGVSHEKCGSAECCQVTIARYRIGSSYNGSTEGIDFSLSSVSEFRCGRCNAGLFFSEMDTFSDPPEGGLEASLAKTNNKLIEQVGLEIVFDSRSRNSLHCSAQFFHPKLSPSILQAGRRR